MTQNHKTLRVELGPKSYDIHVGAGLMARTHELAAEHLEGRRVVIVTDETVGKHYLAALRKSVERACGTCHDITVPAGEASKSMDCLGDVVERMLALGVDRQSVVIALGGGVVGDLAGFAASTLLRGVDFIQVPTSLLAQVDSSVGGKTGVNAKAGKNLIGAFHQPVMVIADTDSLETLPARELVAGYAEVVKYGLLGDSGFFGWLEANWRDVLARAPKAIEHAVITSCGAKARIVEEDERESGRRALLNLGHTFAHALEAAAGYDGSLLHGEAVGTGMALAFDLAVVMELCPGQDKERVRAHLEDVGLHTRLAALAGARKCETASDSELIATMRRDKKARDGRLRLVLPRAIGDSFICDDVKEADIKHVLEESR